MPNNVEKMSIYYSPNFDLTKRNKKKIKYLIFHYTGMKSDFLSIKKLTNQITESQGSEPKTLVRRS